MESDHKEPNVNRTFVTAEDLSSHLRGIILPVTCLVAIETLCGILGNALILIVYYKWYKRCNFRCFVLCMALIDLVSSLTTLPGEIVSHMDWYTYEFDSLCKIKSFFNVFTVWSSGLILLLLAYDRNRKICSPLSRQVPTYVARKLCVACLILSFLLSFPIAIFWGKQSYKFTNANHTIEVSICEKSDKYANCDIPFIYIISALVIPMSLVMVVTAGFNVCTGKKLLIKLDDCVPCTNVTNNPAAPSINPETSCQTSSVKDKGQSGHSQIHLPASLYTIRRFSFPTGRNTWRNKHVQRNHSQHTEVNGNVKGVEQYPVCERTESGSSQFIHQGVCACTCSKASRRPHYSDADVSISTSRPCFREWQEHYLRQRARSRRRKTVIMLLLSTVFTITTSLYLALISNIANPMGLLRRLSNAEKVIFFLFLRMYFINTLINPFIYGCMDNRFRKGLKKLFHCDFLTRKPTATHETFV